MKITELVPWLVGSEGTGWGEYPVRHARGVVAEIRAIVDSGHTGIKFDPFPHRPGVSPANDRYLDGRMSRAEERQAMELTALIREAAGPDVELLIDAHGRFDVPTAIRLGQALDELGDIHWYEEPVPPES
jgi:galactonate dehydratase